MRLRREDMTGSLKRRKMEGKFTYTPEIPEVFRCRVPLPDTAQAFVINGLVQGGANLPGGVSLAEVSGGGSHIAVEKGVKAPGTLQIIAVRDSSAGTPLNLTHQISVGEDSSFSLLLCSHTLTLDSYSTIDTIALNAGPKSVTEVVVMQNENNNSSHETKFVLNIADGALVKITIVTLHGAKISNEVVAHINGEQASCELNGLCLADGSQEMSTIINMHHHKPNCHSSQLFKGILDDDARSSFAGKIFVDRDAQKTEAYQANHNLLLKRTAKAFVQPQLVIYADDVKCSHGATSGRLDEEALFYMRSRGIGRDEAKLLQQLAFVNDVLETITNENLKIRLEELVESRLRGEFSHCANCSVNCC